MAVDTPRITRMRLLAAKIETNTGTAETLAAADADYLIIDPQLTDEVSMIDQNLQAALGSERAIAGAKKGTLTFSMYMAGKGSASAVPEWATIFLAACDMLETTGTFAFVHGGATLTLALFEDGIQRTLSGARGSFKITCKAGEPAKIEFTFTGKLGAETTTAILNPTFPSVIAPVWGGGALTIGSYTPRLAELTLDAGNGVVMREDATDATGYFAAAITTRKPVGSADPESVSGRNWRSVINSNTEEALSLVIGSTQYNTITIAAPRCQATKRARGNRNDLITDQVDLQFNGASPFTIAFS